MFSRKFLTVVLFATTTGAASAEGFSSFFGDWIFPSRPPKVDLATARSGAISFQLDGSVKADQIATIQRDFAALANLDLSSDDAQLAQLLGVKQVNTETMQNWLRDRVSTIVGQDFKPERAVFLVQKNVQYANTETPLFEKASPPPPPKPDPARPASPPTKGYTVMSNIGAALYTEGKSQNAIFGIRLSDGSSLQLTSPRVGMIAIGEGLFLKQLQPNQVDPNAISNSIFRLATFFHEARHSDGNGKGLSFSHAVCPPKHDYENVNACDRNLNGPYRTGAEMTNLLLQKCPTCSIAEKERLKLAFLDSYNRVIEYTSNDVSKPLTVGASMPSWLKACIDTLKARIAVETDEARKGRLQTWIAQLESQLAEAESALRLSESVTPSKNWDPTPERAI